MAYVKRVHFSPILEQPSDITSVVGSDIGLFPEGMDFEDAYIASLSKNAKKYRVPTERNGEPREPRTRKIALLTLGFILLLGIGAVAIYLIARELYNKEGHNFSGNVGEKKTGFPEGNSSLNGYTLRLATMSTIMPSSETRKDQISMYSREETISTQTQTNLIFTAASVYKPSALVTGFGSRKQNATLCSTPSTPMSETSSREAATPSFFKRDLSSLLYISGTTSCWSEPDTLIRKTGSRISGLNRSSASVESSSSDSFQSNTGSTWFSGDRTAKSAAPLIEKVIYITQASPLMSTQNAYVQSTTTTLNNVGSLIISSPYSRSKYTWPSSGTVVRKWTEKSYSKSLLCDNVHETTKQSGQNQFDLTVVPTSKPRFASRNSVKSVKLETGTMAIITDTIDISRFPTTKSTGISLSAKHLDSTHVVNTFSKCLTKSNITLDRVLTTSRPTATSNMVKNTTDKTITLKWTTQMPEIASPPNHISAYSIQVSLSSKASSKTSIFGSSTSLDKENDTRSSTLATPLLSSLRFSDSEFVSQPSRTLSHGFTSAVMTVSPLLLSTLTQETWTVEEIQTTNCTITSSASVLPISYSTASNTVTTTRRKDPSTAVLVEFKSMESSDVYAANSVATQSKMNSVTVQTLLPYITHGGLSTANDLTSHITSQEPSWSLPSIHLSLTIAKVLSSASAISLNTISVFEPQTNAITLKQIETHTESWISSPKEFITLPISSVSPDNSLDNRDTVSSEAAGISNDSSYILQFTFQTDLRNKLTIDSQSTSTLMTSFSTDALASTSRLDGAVFPVFTSSVHHLKTKEYVKESRLQYKTVSFSATDPHTAFPYSLHKSTGDTLAHSEVSKVTTVVPSSTMFLSRSAVQISSTIRTSSSQMISLGLAIVTSSIQHLESEKSIQERLSRYKTLSFSTTTFQSISHSSLSLTKSTNTRRIPITTASPAVRYTALSQELLSSASGSSVRVSTDISFTSGMSIGVTSSNISLHGSLTTHFPYLKANSNQSGILAPNYTSILQVIPSEDAISHHYRSLITTFMPTMYPTSNVTVSFKIMDGSLIIRNKNYHRNLSNPNTTMFKALADEVEAIIKDIMSFNNTDVLDVEVISFRNGSVIADFYLRVRYDTPLSDQQYAQLLSEANETVWRGFYVTNITVTLRAKVKASPEPSRGEDDADLSKTAIIATLTVFAVLLIAVGSIGVYVCKKKGMCDGSKVKPAHSPIPPSELEKIQPVRRDTWVTNDQPFLAVDVPTDANYRSSPFYETLSMRVLERKDTEPDESVDPDLLRESTRSPFEPEYTNDDAMYDSAVRNANPSTSRSISNPSINDVDRPISGSSRNTYLNIASNSSTLSEDDHAC